MAKINLIQRSSRKKRLKIFVGEPAKVKEANRTLDKKTDEKYSGTLPLCFCPDGTVYTSVTMQNFDRRYVER